MALVLILLCLTIPVQVAVLSFKKNADGVTCTLDKGLMKEKNCFDNMVEVKYITLPICLNKPSLVITNDWKYVPGFSVSDNTTEIVVTTSKLKVLIKKQTNAIKLTQIPIT